MGSDAQSSRNGHDAFILVVSQRHIQIKQRGKLIARNKMLLAKQHSAINVLIATFIDFRREMFSFRNSLTPNIGSCNRLYLSFSARRILA